MSFSVFDFHPRLVAGIDALGFTDPTPIQAEGIPPGLEGRDVLGLAQTGTGKTAAFVLPILQRLIGRKGRGLRALILAPTRELAEQIHEVICDLAPHTGIHSVTVYGGVNMNRQIAKLRSGTEIAVACPGRLLDHFQQKTINVSQLEVLVIDEADRMFDMGFLKDIRRVIAYLPKERQTLLFSATMPDEINRLTRDVLKDPVTVKIGHAAPTSTVEHAFYPVSQKSKTPLLFEILRRTETGSVLIFTRTKHRAKKLALKLRNEGYTAAELQGNLSQNRRQAALDGFRDGTYRIMVATDIAARGIDVSTISHVINYDIPDSADAYTHRIGRTGRMTRTGDAFTFITGEDKAMIRAIEKVMGAPVERRQIEGFVESSAEDKTFGRTDDPRSRSRRPSGGNRRKQEPRTEQNPRSKNTRSAGTNSTQPSKSSTRGRGRGR